jgi:hypothetical protein
LIIITYKSKISVKIMGGGRERGKKEKKWKKRAFCVVFG